MFSESSDIFCNIKIFYGWTGFMADKHRYSISFGNLSVFYRFSLSIDLNGQDHQTEVICPLSDFVLSLSSDKPAVLFQ
jgi:hypothetical protein